MQKSRKITSRRSSTSIRPVSLAKLVEATQFPQPPIRARKRARLGPGQPTPLSTSRLDEAASPKPAPGEPAVLVQIQPASRATNEYRRQTLHEISNTASYRSLIGPTSSIFVRSFQTFLPIELNPSSSFPVDSQSTRSALAARFLRTPNPFGLNGIVGRSLTPAVSRSVTGTPPDQDEPPTRHASYRHKANTIATSRWGQAIQQSRLSSVWRPAIATTNPSSPAHHALRPPARHRYPTLASRPIAHTAR